MFPTFTSAAQIIALLGANILFSSSFFVGAYYKNWKLLLLRSTTGHSPQRTRANHSLTLVLLLFRFLLNCLYWIQSATSSTCVLKWFLTKNKFLFISNRIPSFASEWIVEWIVITCKMYCKRWICSKTIKHKVRTCKIIKAMTGFTPSFRSGLKRLSFLSSDATRWVLETEGHIDCRCRS